MYWVVSSAMATTFFIASLMDDGAAGIMLNILAAVSFTVSAILLAVEGGYAQILAHLMAGLTVVSTVLAVIRSIYTIRRGVRARW